MKTTSKPKWAESDIVIFPEFLHSELLLESRIKTEIQPSLKLDGDSQICRPYLTPQGCPLGYECPKRHTNPSPANYQITPISNTPQGRTVCKHWLRGLCKKGTDCEYLHEYNLRKMPECYFFTKHGFCSSADECMYLHILPFHRRPECRSYTAGFCRAGPNCPNKHIKRVACPLYLVGFCPDGPECKLAHPPAVLADIERAARGDENPRQHRERDFQQYGGGGDQMQSSSYPPHAVSGDVVMDGMQFRRAPGKHLRGVTCFKCGMEGHLANACPNPSVPGNRGGVERGPGGRPMIL